jgi:hypothetical protein
MKLVDEDPKRKPSFKLNGTNGMNGNNHTTVHPVVVEESESESDGEEVEPVSASLVLRVVSEAPSPSVSRSAIQHYLPLVVS